MSPTGPKDDDGVLLAPKPKQKPAYERKYRVVFYNDDYTTKWFVVHVVQQVFRMSETAATAFCMAVHRNGKGVAGVYSRDIAETKAQICMDMASELQMPLMVTAEPEDEG